MSNGNGSENRLLIVSNRLPVSLESSDGDMHFKPSVGGLATSLNALRERREMLWFGWPGMTVESPTEQAEIEARLQEDFNAIPLFLPQDHFDRYYNGFSNGSIWPLFHYFTQFAHYSRQEYASYDYVNSLFCEKIAEIARPDDTIWVHDYHLMLLPGLLRKALPDASIGFFLHIPFPSSEIFRILPWREEILEGLLGADLVGFHSYGYVRHFFSSLLRILGLEHEFGQAIVNGRPVRVDTFPLGVDVDRFEEAAEIPEVKEGYEVLRQQASDRKIVLSVDRLDFTKGIPERLETFEAFLDYYPEWKGKVSLISLCVPSRTDVPEYASLKSQVDELVGRINGELGRPGWIPIWYIYRSLPFEELVPLYMLADVALVTPLRDGMNLVAKEYLATRGGGQGVLVLSETAGSAEELGEALIVNPHDQDEVIEALRAGLEMSAEEQIHRNRSMVGRLRRYDTVDWARDFLGQLEQVHNMEHAIQLRRLVGKDRAALLESFENASRRLILLDYDGTLVGFVSRPEEAAPDKELIELLKELVALSETDVVLISGRHHAELGDWLGETGIDLVAEHGARYRLTGEQTWNLENEAAGDEWQNSIRPVLESYTIRTPGSQIEYKDTSLVWHYRMADPELGSQRAMELMNTLESYVANTPLSVQQGAKIIEVKPSGIGKGRAAQRWLANGSYEFVLAIGDDTTDEDLFAAMPEGSWTVKVGPALRSNAIYSVPGPIEVRRLLKEILALPQ